MIQLTDEMRENVNNALANGISCVLATASSKGELGISFRGSMMVWDDESLAYWERSRRTALEHIEEHGKVAVMFRNPAERVGWKFFGTATVYRDGPMREQVMARVVQRELDLDQERQGFAVIIRLDQVTTLGDRLLMEREQQTGEE